MNDAALPRSAVGTVYLVGAGPGDPGLLTLRGAELIAAADAVVYDALANPALLEHARTNVELHDVGKRAGRHSRTQDEINALLVELAARHASVVRLKGGDPFVFGRGGEEALALRAAGVPFEIVPGVTAGVAAAAYAGIPVTQRGMAATLTFATGHEDPDKPGSDLDWAGLARVGGTVVFYMGVGRMAENFRRLVDAGRSADTPAAIIEWGTYARQRTVSGTIATLPDLAARAGIGAPALIVVGGVVHLRDSLRWFDVRPLTGMRVVVTRARAQASSLARALTDLGAEVIEFPTIRIAPPSDLAPLQDAVRRLPEFGWIVFTSANGVEAFFAALCSAGLDARALAGARLCAVGPATAAALARHGLRADLIPPEYVGDAVVGALAGAGELREARVLLVRAEVARAALPDELRARGATVHEVAVYQTLPDAGDAARVRELFAARQVDVVTFTAGSTVRNFAALVGPDLGGAAVISIGPRTSEAARAAGYEVAAEAGVHTVEGVVAAVRALAASRLTGAPAQDADAAAAALSPSS